MGCGPHKAHQVKKGLFMWLVSLKSDGLVARGFESPRPAPKLPRFCSQYMILRDQTETLHPVAFAFARARLSHQRCRWQPERHAPKKQQTTPARSLLIAARPFFFLGQLVVPGVVSSGPASRGKVWFADADTSALVQELLNKASSVVCLGTLFHGASLTSATPCHRPFWLRPHAGA